jgi:hypothetical protein
MQMKCLAKRENPGSHQMLLWPFDADDHLIRRADFSLRTACPMSGLFTERSKLPQIRSYLGRRIYRAVCAARKTNVAFLMQQVQNNLMSNDQDSKIAGDGLRYKRKESGSPFKNTGSMGTISCYKCGLHKPRSMGIFKKLINQQMFMCGDCMPAKSA